MAPDVWRRTMTLVLDGLRAEHANAELPSLPLQQEQVDEVMASYRASRRRS